MYVDGLQIALSLVATGILVILLIIRLNAIPVPRGSSNGIKPLKSKPITPRIIALVRDGNVVEFKRNVKELEDGSLLVDNTMLYKVKNKPYILKLGRHYYRLYILDKNSQIAYEFEDVDYSKLIEDVKKARLSYVVLNPKVLYNYIASHSVNKLLGRITVSKTEALLYMFTGMVIIVFIMFVFLPLLGHEILIK